MLESAVVGSPHSVRGQEVKAFVVLTPGALESKQLADRVFQYCKNKLASYKVPRKWVFVEEMPYTSSGKIARAKLIEVIGSKVKSH